MAPDPKTQAEMLRKRYQYRRLILEKKVALPRQAAAGLIGPDCAYHLYRYHGDGPSQDGKNT